jgi:hypothetical protein
MESGPAFSEHQMAAKGPQLTRTWLVSPWFSDILFPAGFLVTLLPLCQLAVCDCLQSDFLTPVACTGLGKLEFVDCLRLSVSPHVDLMSLSTVLHSRGDAGKSKTAHTLKGDLHCNCARPILSPNLGPNFLEQRYYITLVDHA